MRVIGLMGPSTGGKSTIIKTAIMSLEKRGLGLTIMYRPIATYLKTEAAEKFGWDGTKSPEQRALLQNTSEQYKREFGEDIFIRKCVEHAEEAEADILFMDDVRHAVEIAYMRGNVQQLSILNVVEPEAESLWEAAFAAHRRENDAFAWAAHRSELEWRGFRHMFPEVYNDKTSDSGLTNSVNKVLELSGL